MIPGVVAISWGVRSWARGLAIAVTLSVTWADLSALSCLVVCHETTERPAVTEETPPCHQAARSDEAAVQLASAPSGCPDNDQRVEALSLPVRGADRFLKQSAGLPIALPMTIAASGHTVLPSSTPSSPPRLARPSAAPLRL